MTGAHCTRCDAWAPKGHFAERTVAFENEFHVLRICKQCQKLEIKELNELLAMHAKAIMSTEVARDERRTNSSFSK
jgi:hypothetical protein